MEFLYDGNFWDDLLERNRRIFKNAKEKGYDAL